MRKVDLSNALAVGGSSPGNDRAIKAGNDCPGRSIGGSSTSERCPSLMEAEERIHVVTKARVACWGIHRYQ